MGKKTALHQVHVDGFAKLVNFSGYCLPLHYGSLLSEHESVRQSAGMFDISHMCVLDIRGAGATQWLRLMFSNDVAKLSDWQGMYTCLCRENGGVIDDLIVFRINEHHYRLSIDAARREKDLAWMKGHLSADVEIDEVQGNSLIAIQGPDAVAQTMLALDSMNLHMALNEMPRFSAQSNDSLFVTRTGFTGEDGVEITVPTSLTVDLWRALAEQGVKPAGLGARDTLRLEAGLGLYGQDIDDQYSPAESGIGRTIDINDDDRAFIGREVLEDHKLFGGRYVQIGLALDDHGMLRRGAAVQRVGQAIGTITSGGYSPTREISVALARVNRTFTGSCDVSVQERLRPARITSLPFVPHGLARE